MTDVFPFMPAVGETVGPLPAREDRRRLVTMRHIDADGQHAVSNTYDYKATCWTFPLR